MEFCVHGRFYEVMLQEQTHKFSHLRISHSEYIYISTSSVCGMSRGLGASQALTTNIIYEFILY